MVQRVGVHGARRVGDEMDGATGGCPRSDATVAGLGVITVGGGPRSGGCVCSQARRQARQPLEKSLN